MLEIATFDGHYYFLVGSIVTYYTFQNFVGLSLDLSPSLLSQDASFNVTYSLLVVFVICRIGLPIN